MTFHRCLLDPVLLTGLIMSLHVATGCIEIEEGSVCTSNGSSYTLFGTKTTYVNARAELAKRFDFDESKLSQLIQDLNCGLTPTRMYVFARHSIKYPKANAIAQMQNLHSYYIPIVQANVARTLQNQQSCSSVLNAVIDWTPKFEKKLAYQITESGLNETKFIG